MLAGADAGFTSDARRPAAIMRLRTSAQLAIRLPCDPRSIMAASGGLIP